MAEVKHDKAQGKGDNSHQRIRRVANVLTEKNLDLVRFADNYAMIEVPITYGSRMGKVYIFSHEEDQIHKNFIELYKGKLCRQINVKKFEISKKAGCDVGPAIAVASLIEDGDYDKFLGLFNEYISHEIHKNMREGGVYDRLLSALDNPITEKICKETLETIEHALEERKLKSLEQVLLVHDQKSGKFYHMMPGSAKVKMAYENTEQAGLMQFSIYRSIKDKLFEFPDENALEEDYQKEMEKWLSSESKSKLAKLREVLEESQVKKLEAEKPGTGEEKRPVVFEFKQCVIFENVFDKMREALR